MLVSAVSGPSICSSRGTRVHAPLIQVCTPNRGRTQRFRTIQATRKLMTINVSFMGVTSCNELRMAESLRTGGCRAGWRRCPVGLCWQLGRDPRFDAADEVADVWPSGCFQQTATNCRAITSLAVNDDGTIRRDFGQPLAQVCQRNVVAASDVPGLPFLFRANIEDERTIGSRELFRECRCCDPRDDLNQIRVSVQSDHAVTEITRDIVEADAA